MAGGKEYSGAVVEQDLAISVAPAEAAALWRSGNALFVDVRRAYEREGGRIAGSDHVEMNELSVRAAELPRDRTIVFYCRRGNRSLMAAEAFRQAGYQAHHIEGGLQAWVAEGLPLDPPGGVVRDPLPAS